MEINEIIEKFNPLAVFKGGSCGCDMNVETSDIDIIILLDSSQHIYLNKKDSNYHYITTTIEKELNVSGLLFLENLLYYKNDSIYNWLQNNLKTLNIIHIQNNKSFNKEIYLSAYSYKIIAFYNYYYDKTELLNIRDSDCQYHHIYFSIIKKLKEDFKTIEVDKEQIVQSFYESIGGDE